MSTLFPPLGKDIEGNLFLTPDEKKEMRDILGRAMRRRTAQNPLPDPKKREN